MTEDLAKFFSPVIAYVLPGLVGLYGASFHVPVLRVWFGTAAEKESTVGGFLFIVLASLATGLVLQGLRCLSVEYLMPERPPFDYSKRGTDDVERALGDIRAQHYAYYQFYGNMLCAVVVAFVGWQTASRPPWPTFARAVAALLVGAFVLFWSARDSLKRYDEKASGILGIAKLPNAESAPKHPTFS